MAVIDVRQAGQADAAAAHGAGRGAVDVGDEVAGRFLYPGIAAQTFPLVMLGLAHKKGMGQRTLSNAKCRIKNEKWGMARVG